MLQNPRIGAPAFEYLHFALSYRWPTGWMLTSIGRREGQADFEQDRYEDLDVFELVDVVNAELARRLGV